MIFFKEFIKNTKQIGSIVPSSRFLAKAISTKINYQTANIIVELGAGTGVFTENLIENLDSNTRLFIFETNPSFYKTLCQKFLNKRNVYIINDCAENLNAILALYGVKKVDYIVSGLPFLNFSQNIRTLILQNIYECLDGEFILFQYTTFLEKELTDFFTIKTMEKVYLNFPPAIIYCLF